MGQPCILFADFETYYDDEYSLRKMPTPNYILDARYETIMLAAAVDDGPQQIIDGPDVGDYLSQFDPAVTTTVTFNSLFDNSIFAWNYGFVPVSMLDTMAMARTLRGHKLTHANLGAVSEHLGIGSKLQTLAKVKGMRRDQIKANGLWSEFSTYAMDDNEKNRGIFKALINDFPRSERRLMDLVIRCTVEPVFRVDKRLLVDHIEQLKLEKVALLERCGLKYDEKGKCKEIMSSAKFQGLLENLGVTVEYKVSAATQKSIPAFAKTDEFMTTLTEHEDPDVQALASARLGLKSTLEETRGLKLLSIAVLPWERYRDGSPRLYTGGTMPVPLRFGGAHTHRLSGEWKMNMQNMPTVRGSKGKSKLRRALIAPPGHSVLVADLGQIEARLVAWVCACALLVKQFAEKLDPYNALGTQIFGFPVDRKIQIPEGFIGKTGILGLGYGCGPDHFYDMVCKMARSMGLDLTEIGWSTSLALRSTNAYRNMYHEIPAGWNRLDWLLKNAWLGTTGPMGFGPGNVVMIEKGRVHLPSDLYLEYDDPRIDATTGELYYTYGRFHHKLYGAKFLENIVQALARIIVMNAALRIRDRLGRMGFFKLQAHDELVFIIPDDKLDYAKQIVHTEMTRSPSWAKSLPLTADVGVGKSYGEAK